MRYALLSTLAALGLFQRAVASSSSANDNAAATTEKVAQQLRDKFMHQCRKLFFECDYDKSGTLSQDEQWLQYSKVGFDIHAPGRLYLY